MDIIAHIHKVINIIANVPPIALIAFNPYQPQLFQAISVRGSICDRIIFTINRQIAKECLGG